MSKSKRICNGFILFVWIVFILSFSSYAKDFSVQSGQWNQYGTTPLYNSNSLRFVDTEALWCLHMDFVASGAYTVSANVAVSAANAGSTLEISDWIPQHDAPASSAQAALSATDPSGNVNPQWQQIGQINITQTGRHYIAFRMLDLLGENSGIIYQVRIEGPASVTAAAPWTAKALAAFCTTSDQNTDATVKYGEIIPRPWPVPIRQNGIHTVISVSGGYSHQNGYISHSIWASTGADGVSRNPDILVANGAARNYHHEGNGSSASLDEFYLDLNRRRRGMQFLTPAGPNTISTFLAGEVGQRWHMVGRMSRYGVKTFGDNSGNGGFIEPLSEAFNIGRRSAAWGNSWTYAKHDGEATRSWDRCEQMKASFKGPTPDYPPPYPENVKVLVVYGKSRIRQDMMEVMIGGQLHKGDGVNLDDTQYYYSPGTGQTLDLPSLNLACVLNEPDQTYQFSNAQVAVAYGDNLTTQIHDPHCPNPFDYEKLSGPPWLVVNPNGQLSGNPGASDQGLNLFAIKALSYEMGLEGKFSVGIYVAGPGNNTPALIDPLQYVQTASNTDDPVLETYSIVDPDASDSHTLSIISGNTGNVFGVDQAGKALIKALTPPVGMYNLTLRVSDNGSPAQSVDTTIQVEVVNSDGRGGATRDIWYNTLGDSLDDLLNDPRYPNNPDRVSAIRDYTNLAVRMASYRIHGYVYPPTTGTYQFYFYNVGVGQFSLSTDDQPANKTLYTNGTAVALTAGQRYYFESLTKSTSNYGEGTLRLEWSGPGISQQIVAAEYLSPYDYPEPDFGQDVTVLRDVLVGESYSEDIHPKVKRMDLKQSLTYEMIGDSDWLSTTPDGILTGVPSSADVGVNTFTLRITAPGGLYDETTIQIEVKPNSAPQFTTGLIQLPDMDAYDVLQGYSAISLADYVTDENVGPRLGYGDVVSLSIVSGPDWLNIEPTGELFGAPGNEDIGLNTFTLHATDLGGLTAETQIQVTVNPGTFPPVMTDLIKRYSYANQWIEGSLAGYAHDPDGDTLTYTKISGPEWLTVQSDGSYSGRPNVYAPLTNDIVVEVSDGNGGTDQGTLRITVLPDFRIVYEGFEGTAGTDIDGTTGGTGWAEAWSGNTDWDFASSGLAFPGLDDANGLSSTMGGQGSTISRSFAVPVTVGSGSGQVDELWIGGVMNLYAAAGIASGHSMQVKLLNSDSIGYFGKGVNRSIGFDLGGWHEISGGLGIGNGTAGLWFMVLHLKASGDNTDIAMYAAREDETFDITDPTTFPHTTSASYTGKVSFDGLGMYRWNNTESFIDEICVSQWYETVIEKMTPAIPARIVYEPFDGADGTDLNGTGSGTGWTGNWTQTTGLFQYSDPSNTFDVLETTGQKALFLGSGGGTSRYSRSLTSAVTVDASNSELWVSTLVEIGSGAGDVNAGRGIGVELTNAGTPVVGFGKKLNGKFGVGTNMTTDWVNSTVAASSIGVRFLALQLAFDGTDTVATVYVADGETQAGLDLSDVSTFAGTATLTIPGAVTLDGVNLYGYHADTTSNSVDEIVFARQYASLLSSSSSQDLDPPIPDPSSFEELPDPTGTFSVSMKAEQALDPSGAEYYFTCTVGGGNDSGWQNSTIYTDTGLLPDVQYSYTVKARDLSDAHNETAASGGAEVVIDLYDGKLGMSDFAFFAQQWMQINCGFCTGTDLTGDGNVSIDDLLVFAGNWVTY